MNEKLNDGGYRLCKKCGCNDAQVFDISIVNGEMIAKPLLDYENKPITSSLLVTGSEFVMFGGEYYHPWCRPFADVSIVNASRKKTNISSAQHWNDILAKEGLSVDKGRSRKLLYVGDSYDLDIIQTYNELDKTGRRRGEAVED